MEKDQTPMKIVCLPKDQMRGKCMIANSDKRAASQAVSRRLTKKQRLLELVRRHPFLSVDEIAQTIGTTPRYVRTSLSEAGLSLLELRRQQARQLSQGLYILSEGAGSAGTSDIVQGETGEARIRDVRIVQTINPEIAARLDASPDAPMLEIRRLRTIGEQPVFASCLVTARHVVVTDAVFAAATPLFDLLAIGDVQSVAVGEYFVDVADRDDPLVRMLHTNGTAPIVRLGCVLSVEEEPVAAKLYYFDGTQVQVVFSNDAGPTVRFIHKGTLQRELSSAHPS